MANVVRVGLRSGASASENQAAFDLAVASAERLLAAGDVVFLIPTGTFYVEAPNVPEGVSVVGEPGGYSLTVVDGG